MGLPLTTFFRRHGWLALSLHLILCGLCNLSLAIGPENVLVLYNADDGNNGVGKQIADHYQFVHPGAHAVGLTGVNDILYGTNNENVSGADYLSALRPQILDAIGSIPDSVDVIVTTKGLPLRINAGPDPGGVTKKWGQYSSFESELTRIDSIDTINKMGSQFILAGFPQMDTSLPSNPYYNDNVPFVRAGSDPVNGDIRLSSRLDGYSLEAVIQSINRAQNVYVVPTGHYFVADDDPTAGIDQIVNQSEGPAGDGPGPGLVNWLQNLGWAFVSDYDQNNATKNLAITTAPGPVIGYVSHGTNDGPGGLEADYVLNQLDFQLARGAVFHTHESFNAQTFNPVNTQEDGLIGDWLQIGGTAGVGHVHEPYNGRDNVANEDLLFQMLLPGVNAQPGDSGLTFVEAAWNATRQLSYVNTVVGDPLMRWRKWIPGDTNLDGMVEFNDFYTMQGNWWQTGSFADGDFNGDNIINAEDFDILRQNWMASTELATLGTASIHVWPALEQSSGTPFLAAKLLAETNLDGDLDVDGDDLEILLASYGIDAGGDADQDGDTDGDDFLMWQRQYQLYTLTADFNINGTADAKDLEIWENSYGKNRGGDADGNGVTDGDDFLAWQRETRVPAPPVVAVQAIVPEPASVSLLLVSAAVFVARRRRRG